MSSNENKDYETMPITFDKKLGLPLWKDVRTLPIKYTIAISKIREFFDGLEEGR
ncbi:MAG: 3-hydroxybutyryl-CoA epimerase, partial [Thermoprotei archaeon]